MAQQLPRRLTLLVMLFLAVGYSAHHRVFGIGTYSLSVEAVYEQTDRKGKVDEKNMFRTEDRTMVELFPHPDSTYIRLMNSSSRRELGDFLSCASCKCCDRTLTYCQEQHPCCFSINCDLYVFGVCKFVAISCVCTGCIL